MPWLLRVDVGVLAQVHRLLVDINVVIQSPLKLLLVKIDPGRGVAEQLVGVFVGELVEGVLVVP